MQYRVIRNSNKMRLSCNGCRVLRKGCSDDCSIRPCLDWIKCPYKQANATVFLAKFYGRAGLLNLIHGASPDHRPAIFRSLLYEACGRILDPIFGSVGLLWSGSWQLCHDAVEAVLRGDPITRITADAAEAAKNGPPLKAYDIRHANKADEESGMRRVRRRCRVRARGPNSKRARVSLGSVDVSEVNRSPSHESSLSHQSEAAAELKLERVSVETALNAVKEDDGGIELDLRLGYEPFKRCVKKPSDVAMKRADGSAEDDAVFCKMQLGLDYWAS